MSFNRDMIMETLHNSNLGDKTYEEVVADFKVSDELSAYLAEATDDAAVEAMIAAHLPEYLAMQGVGLEMPDIDPTDPTATQAPAATAPAMPTVTSAQSAAIAQWQHQDIAAREMFSQSAEVKSVLIKLPYPGEFMVDTEALRLKKAYDEVAQTINTEYNPGRNIPESMKANGTEFIPTNAQLAEVWAFMSAGKTTDGKAPATPAWLAFDNDAAIATIRETINNNGTFKAYIPPKESTDKANPAWRWNTQGFRITAPSGDTVEDLFVTKKTAMGTLVSRSTGIIPPRGKGLGLKLVAIKDKKASTSVAAGAVKEKQVLRAINNNPKYNPETIVISQPAATPRSATVKSEAFYYVVKITKAGTPRVTKCRLSLAWENAPKWEVKPEYEKYFGSSNKDSGVMTAAQLAKMQQDSSNFVATIIAQGSVVAAEYGLEDVYNQVAEFANKAAAQAADDLAI